MFYEKGRIRAAGKATADQVEKVIDADAFERIILDCTKCTSETMFSVDVPFAQADKIIYVAAGIGFNENVRGKKLYYKCATGTNEFNYVLL